MKRIVEVFTDEEFKQLKEAKGDHTWHSFLLTLIKD